MPDFVGRSHPIRTAYSDITYRALTLGQGREIRNLLKFFEHTGREANAERKGSLAAQIDEVAEKGAESMSGIKGDTRADEGSALRKAQDLRADARATSNALQWQMRAADGFVNIKEDGVAGAGEQAFNDKVIEGEVRKRLRWADILPELSPAFDRLANSAAQTMEKYGEKLALKDRDGNPLAVPQAQKDNHRHNWTVDMVIALALNLGNQSSIERVLSGYQDLNVETVAALLGDDAARVLFPEHQGQGQSGILSAQNWRDIQTIWKVIGSQWSAIQAVHERMYGFKPEGIEASPFSLEINGEVVNMAGGYYPARYDRALSSRSDAIAAKEDILERSESIAAIPAAKRGFTRGRSDGAPGLPVLLNTGVLLEHLNDVVTFIELGEAVRFMDRVTQSEQWRAGYIRAFGREDFSAIRRNLSGIVRNPVSPSAGLTAALMPIAEAVRPLMVYAALSFNPNVALFQLSNLVPAIREIGAWNVASALFTIVTRGMVVVKEVHAADPFMKYRLDRMDQELQEQQRQVNPKTRKSMVRAGLDTVAEVGMLGMKALDTVAATAVWLAAYNREIARLSGEKPDRKGVDPRSGWHEQAVKNARITLKKIIPDFDGSSRSEFLRSRGILRLFNMFSSNANLYAQRYNYHTLALEKGKLSTRDYVYYHMWDFVGQGIAMTIAFTLLRGWSDDEEERNEQFLDAALRGVGGTYAMAVPVLGPIINRALIGDTWRGSGLSSMLDGAMQRVTRTWSAGKRAATGGFEEEDVNRLGWAIFSLASFLAKIPADRIIRRAERGHEQWQDGEGGPGLMLMPR